MVGVEIEKVDGRRARGLRTRDAIVSALLDLIASGDIAPTAQRIADRAGVSVRSVYQHFADVEGLYADAAARMFEWVRTTSKDVDQGLPVERRVDEFVDERATMLESLMSFSRAVRVMEPSSQVVHDHRIAMDRWEKDRVARVFASELRSVAGSQRSALHAAIDTLSSAEAWEHLRNTGQSAKGARQVMRNGILALLAAGH